MFELTIKEVNTLIQTELGLWWFDAAETELFEDETLELPVWGRNAPHDEHAVKMALEKDRWQRYILGALMNYLAQAGTIDEGTYTITCTA